MKQTNDNGGWVYIVLHSETLHYQIFSDAQDVVQPRWVRLLLRLIKTGSKFYGLL